MTPRKPLTTPLPGDPPRQPSAREVRDKMFDWLSSQGYAVGAGNGPCDDFGGLPAGVLVRPAWNPTEGGSHVIVVCVTAAYRATRRPPYSANPWVIVETRPYRSQDELRAILKEWETAPRGCW
jgi:hypothetical protein